MVKDGRKLEKELKKELRKLKGMLKKLAEGKKYQRATELVDDYFGNDKYDVILLFESYLVPLMEKLDAEEREELGRVLFGLSINEMQDEDWEFLYSEYGWELTELLTKLQDYEVNLLGSLLVFMADEWLFAHALYEELKYQV